jgi:hypothetical protein
MHKGVDQIRKSFAIGGSVDVKENRPTEAIVTTDQKR